MNCSVCGKRLSQYLQSFFVVFRMQIFLPSHTNQIFQAILSTFCNSQIRFEDQ